MGRKARTAVMNAAVDMGGSSSRGLSWRSFVEMAAEILAGLALECVEPGLNIIVTGVLFYYGCTNLTLDLQNNKITLNSLLHTSYMCSLSSLRIWTMCA